MHTDAVSEIRLALERLRELAALWGVDLSDARTRRQRRGDAKTRARVVTTLVS